MPIYEYQCQDCGHSLERIQKISEPLLTDCPECGQASLQKQISAPSFRLKGTGWYETDFKNSGKPKQDSSTQAKNNDKKIDKASSSVDKPANKVSKATTTETAS